jgi:NADH:ubiquinone oxidoreductase subunit F (NADH-binding)
LELLATALKRLKDIDCIQHGSRIAIHISERTKAVEMTDILLWVYEHGPCGHCREGVMEQLRILGTLPARLLYEAQWDVEDSVRRAARNHSAMSA